MVDLGCQDTDGVGEKDKGVLDAILPMDGLILATLSMFKGKRVTLGAFLVGLGP